MNKKLVAYFSASGTTKKVAEVLAKAIQADLYQILPEKPYTAQDLNWMDKNSRSSIEMRDKTFRPAIKDNAIDVNNYDVIFLGYPVWWYTVPTIVNSFLESYDFSGKKIVLFATSGGSGFGNAVNDLKPSAPNAKIIEGKVLNSELTLEEIKKWALGV